MFEAHNKTLTNLQHLVLNSFKSVKGLRLDSGWKNGAKNNPWTYFHRFNIKMLIDIR